MCPPAATTNSAVSSSSAGERAFPGHGEPAVQQKNTLGHFPSVGGCLDPAARAIRGPSSSDRSIALGCPSRNDPIRTFRPDDRERIDPKTRLTLTAPPPPPTIFTRSRDTYDERMRNGLFGLTQQSWSFVKDIKPGMPLFLYNLSEKRFQGVFEAVSTHPTRRTRAPTPHLVALSFWDKPPGGRVAVGAFCSFPGAGDAVSAVHRGDSGGFVRRGWDRRDDRSPGRRSPSVPARPHTPRAAITPRNSPPRSSTR